MIAKNSVLTAAPPHSHAGVFTGEGFKSAGLLKIDVRACVGTVKDRFAMRRRLLRILAFAQQLNGADRDHEVKCMAFARAKAEHKACWFDSMTASRR